jgi:hypothetical protein
MKGFETTGSGIIHAKIPLSKPYRLFIRQAESKSQSRPIGRPAKKAS